MLPLSCWDDWVKCLKDFILEALGTVLDKVIQVIFGPILEALAQAVTKVMGTIGTFWVYVPTQRVGKTDGTPANDSVAWIWNSTEYISIFVATIGILVACVQMAFTQRGETARDLLRSLITLAVASALAVGVTQLLVEFGDVFSDCIVTTALSDQQEGWRCGIGNTGNGKNFGASILAMLGISAAAGGLGLGLAITIAILAVIAGVIQIVLMVVRMAMLVLLLGVLPIAAAATNTEMGRSWFKKIIGWLLAFVLYKPVAALIYATAIRLTSNNGAGLKWNQANPDDIGPQILNMVAGLTLLVLALFALPALMRFIVPMVAATAGQAGAGMIAAKMIGADKMAQKAQDAVAEGSGEDSGASGSDGGGRGGPSGARNVGRPRRNSRAGSGPGRSSGGTGPSGGSPPGGPGGGAGTGSAASTGGGAGAGASGGASAGAAKAAGPIGVAVAVGVKAFKAGKEASKSVGNEALNNPEPDGGGGGGGGGSKSGDDGGPSGSGGSQRDMNRDRQRDQRQFRDDQDRRDRQDRDGPRGSG